MTYLTKLPWMATLVRHRRWTHGKPRKWTHCKQSPPRGGKLYRAALLLGPAKCPSQMGNKSRVARKMGSIKDLTSVLAITNCVELRRTKVNRKEWKIDRTMEYWQSRLIDWDHVVEVKEDLLANTPNGRLQLLVWDDKGMGMPLRNSINVTGHFASSL